MASSRKRGILVVDDQACLRDILGIGLRQEGFAVWLAANGREAFDLYQRHHETIDVVLMDVCMPGLDGPETLAALQKLNPQIRCCFLSGALDSCTAERLHNLGAAVVLQKPIHLAEVAQVLGEQAGRAPWT
ncbi:MAG TPA: response regulator [Gemmataceae bacterium]|nr:response regulator [Gemmataceae bacterium]